MEDVIENITGFLTKREINFSFKTAEHSRAMLEILLQKFKLNTNNRWVWEGITDGYTVGYSNEEGVLRIAEYLPEFDLEISLVITDDEFFPWPIFTFSREHLIEILYDNRSFEFFLFDKEMKRILFDTHHNSIVVLRSSHLQAPPPYGCPAPPEDP